MTSQPHDQALLFDVPRDTQLELELESAPAQVKLCPSNLGAKREDPSRPPAGELWPDKATAAAAWSAACGEAIEATRQQPARCAVCYCFTHKDGTTRNGHAYRHPNNPRPRGEIRFPAGARIQLTGGPRQHIGKQGTVESVDSPTMRTIRIRGRRPRGAAPELVSVGIRGLRLYAGNGSEL